jgi:hypothetical protein
VVHGKEVLEEPSYFVRTVPTSKYQNAGDGVGGGKYNVLPPKLEGTYPSLCKAWGIDEEGL